MKRLILLLALALPLAAQYTPPGGGGGGGNPSGPTYFSYASGPMEWLPPDVSGDPQIMFGTPDTAAAGHHGEYTNCTGTAQYFADFAGANGAINCIPVLMYFKDQPPSNHEGISLADEFDPAVYIRQVITQSNTVGNGGNVPLKVELDVPSTSPNYVDLAGIHVTTFYSGAGPGAGNMGIFGVAGGASNGGADTTIGPMYGGSFGASTTAGVVGAMFGVEATAFADGTAQITQWLDGLGVVVQNTTAVPLDAHIAGLEILYAQGDGGSNAFEAGIYLQDAGGSTQPGGPLYSVFIESSDPALLMLNEGSEEIDGTLKIIGQAATSGTPAVLCINNSGQVVKGTTASCTGA